MILVTIAILAIAVILLTQSLFSLYQMLYSWEHHERLEASKAPSSFLAPRLSFSVLLPARHEEEVIYQTIQRVWSASYPSHLLEIIVICSADDTGTIAEARRAIHDIGSSQVHIEVFASKPINKPHGLNVGFHTATNEIVTIFDAEDDIDLNIFNIVNTVMLKEGIGVIQSGIQLMNFEDHWFSMHNCLEYFFWFKSGLHFFANAGVIPLGGNTVFMRRDLVERIGGWDENCLTEDADMGIRLSVLKERIRVIYDAHHTTREETPENTKAFIKQRTRWHQGFIQVLRKGNWLQLPRLSQRVLAGITLCNPILQAFALILWPINILEYFLLKESVVTTMLAYLPIYTLALQCLFTLIGAFMFMQEYRLKYSLPRFLLMLLTYIPYQILLSVSAARAVWRTLNNRDNWEKTAHSGAHRHNVTVPVVEIP